MMTNKILNARKPTLSFAFRREGDGREFEKLVSQVNSEVVSHKKLILYVKEAAILGAICYVFVFVLSYAGLLVAETITKNSYFHKVPFFFASFMFFCTFMLFGLGKAFRDYSLYKKLVDKLEADLKEKEVIEESWRFLRAVAFHSPETNIYFLLLEADDGQCLLFHGERFKLKDYFIYAPADMVLVRSLNTQFVINETTSGPSLAIENHYITTLLKEEFPAHGLNVSEAFGYSFKEAIDYYAK